MVSFESIAAMALALPEAVEADHFGAPAFRVRSKIFATMRRDPPRLMVKLDADDQYNLCQGHPDLISPVPGYWGRKGATFVDYARIDDALAEMLLRLAWTGVAPKRLRQSG